MTALPDSSANRAIAYPRVVSAPATTQTSEPGVGLMTMGMSRLRITLKDAMFLFIELAVAGNRFGLFQRRGSHAETVDRRLAQTGNETNRSRSFGCQAARTQNAAILRSFSTEQVKHSHYEVKYCTSSNARFQWSQSFGLFWTARPFTETGN